MKKTTQKLLTLMLGVVMLVGLLPAAAADDTAATVIYDRTATGDATQDLTLAWPTNAPNADVSHVDTKGRPYASFLSSVAADSGQSAYIDIDLDYAMEDSGTLQPPYGFNFNSDDYAAVRLAFTYAYRYDSATNYYNLGQLEKTRVRVSADNGKTWSQDYAAIAQQNYLGDGELAGEDMPRFSLYEVVCDLTGILPAGQTVTTVRIEPFGDYGLQSHDGFQPNLDLYQVRVLGYKDAKDAPAFGAVETVPVSEDTLRRIVVDYVKQYAAGVEWTPKETAGNYLGGYLYKGVPQATYNTANSSSYERFMTLVDEQGVAAFAEGGVYGMDGAAAFADIITRISRAHINGLAQSADTNRLIPLGGLSLQVPGSTTPNWRTGHAGISAQQAYESYALVKPGDIFVSTKGSSQGMIATGETTVVRDASGKIDPTASTVVVTNTPGATPWYHYMVDGVEVVTTTTPNKAPGEYLYGSAWRIDNVVTFEQLWNGCSATSTRAQIRSGHMAYTLYEYTQGAVEKLQVQCNSNFDPQNTRDGVSLGINTNYRLISASAELTDKDSGKVLYDDTYLFHWNNFSSEYNDPALNAVMAGLPVGSYNLTVSVKAGPVTDPNTMAVPETQVLDQDFTVSLAKLNVSADKTIAHQGENVTIVLNAAVDGVTRVDAGVRYDAERFAFDEAATKAANPGLAFEVNSLTGTVNAKGSVSAAQGGAAAKLCFTAVRTAGGPVTGTQAPRFTITQAMVGLNGGGLEEAAAKGLYASVEVGYNVDIRGDFLSGYDLILVYTNDAATFTYAGAPLCDVSENGYLIGGQGYPYTYAWLAPNADTKQLAVGSTAGEVLNYGLDANMSGWVDLADAQQVANVIRGVVTPAADMARCIAADVNKDGRVDISDAAAIWEALR